MKEIFQIAQKNLAIKLNYRIVIKGSSNFTSEYFFYIRTYFDGVAIGEQYIMTFDIMHVEELNEMIELYNECMLAYEGRPIFENFQNAQLAHLLKTNRKMALEKRYKKVYNEMKKLESKDMNRLEINKKLSKDDFSDLIDFSINLEKLGFTTDSRDSSLMESLKVLFVESKKYRKEIKELIEKAI